MVFTLAAYIHTAFLLVLRGSDPHLAEMYLTLIIRLA
jgi:hypothetical protein